MDKVKITDVIEIPLDQLEIGQSQARTRDVDKDIDELVESIRTIGQLEPIVVAPQRDGKYEVLTGQRRVLAQIKLEAPTILAAVLDRAVDEAQAKVISVTENLVRKDLKSTDLIDACTWLYRKYGSIKAVAEETGLRPNVVSQYVKYDQLLPRLKELVDSGEVKMDAALRAQRAASAGRDAPDEDDSVALAKSMTRMSGAQRRKVEKDREENPESPVEDVIETSLTGGKITQVIVTLTGGVHASLQKYAADSELTQDDAAGQLIETGLVGEGYLATGE